MVPAYLYGNEPVLLKAYAGEYQDMHLGLDGNVANVNASFRFKEFYYGSKYTPAAYVAIHEGEDKNNSFQFLVTNNGEKDKRLIAGYRIIENGEEVKIESLQYVEKSDDIKVKIEFNNGVVKLCLNDGKIETVNTKLKNVKSYISVSSSSAEFLLPINKSLKERDALKRAP